MNTAIMPTSSTATRAWRWIRRWLAAFRIMIRRPRHAISLMEATVYLATAVAVLRIRSIKEILGELGQSSPASPASSHHPIPTDFNADFEYWSRFVARRIDAVSYLFASRPVCLPRAIAALWMLRRRGVPSRLTFLVGQHGADTAHATLRVGPRFVTGGELPDLESYAPILHIDAIVTPRAVANR